MAKITGSRFPVDQCALNTNYGPRAVEHLICPVCQDLLDNPLATPCDHHFCRSCCENLMKSGIQTCPLCNKQTYGSSGKKDDDGRAVDTWLFSDPNKSFIRILEGTPMVCSNDGCEEVIPLGEFPQHLASHCTQRIVPCVYDGCQTYIKAVELEVHMKTCPHRTVHCACCNETVTGGCEVWLCSAGCIGNLRNFYKEERSKIQQESRLEKNCMANCIQLLQWQLLEAQRQVQSLKAELQARISGDCKRKRVSDDIIQHNAAATKSGSPTISISPENAASPERQEERQQDFAIDWTKMETALLAPEKSLGNLN
ncbi:zinc finger, C3HC4 type (RING finger) domain-containing protein [Toxoplasma gondii RUB]|uniref:Zinc finger, C3HC4 type (RING finger) domain-containing protein n=8 Tax=Toxoplasma gondii TaxID=5811 RepID=V4YN80_TOXGV|nr:zinc finger, C3HC4 type (RING finger) domain-containing protein [Toxoplasma gondii VEG]KFG31022.1 zinc finger, C3HC4 type (RING finger) domain-containing protein [Toxoplasma gondii GAB2-2007-GAL-DOM2]KFG36189.1 zinc finger, C3HC4 type (RING finger) domain-containing protein [Toxoplasma gondii FOU]KFG43527.1 zinc finger, C3HC4 type (RING finger) domain-containing protein [Toxoplasma gondii p89]KFG57136.1 zinc finger, C3HC4 type (RING finger) domain-containing protein [Toxoplasma gondii RUB]K